MKFKILILFSALLLSGTISLMTPESFAQETDNVFDVKKCNSMISAEQFKIITGLESEDIYFGTITEDLTQLNNPTMTSGCAFDFENVEGTIGVSFMAAQFLSSEESIQKRDMALQGAEASGFIVTEGILDNGWNYFFLDINDSGLGIMMNSYHEDLLITINVPLIGGESQPITEDHLKEMSGIIHDSLNAEAIGNDNSVPEDNVTGIESDSNTIEEPESEIMSMEQEEQIQQIEIADDGIYTKNRLKTQMLALDQEVHIVFVITESMIGETTKAVVRHQIVSTQDTPFDTKDVTEFRWDSLNSKEIIFPFSPQETGEFFLEQELLYSHDDNFSPAGGISTTPFHVVEKFSKASGEDGLCKKTGMVSLFKPDFSTNVCVTPQTAMKLIARWYQI